MHCCTSQTTGVDCAHFVYHENLFTVVQNVETSFYGELKPASDTFLGGCSWIVAQYVALAQPSMNRATAKQTLSICDLPPES